MDVVTFGETMVVFEPVEMGALRYVDRFKKGVGGAESNVAIGVAKLGHSVGWISKVGNDELGKYVISAIRGEGVDTSQVVLDDGAPTGLYLKEKLRDDFNRVYYYRAGSAASRLGVEDINWAYMKQAKIIHITGITPLLSDSCYELCHAVLDFAKENGIFASFDPNLRMKLLANVPDGKERLLALASKADLVMPGRDEAAFLFDTDELAQMFSRLLTGRTTRVVIKDGAKGAHFMEEGKEPQFVPSCPVDKVVDPVGAGDGFAAGVLASLLEGKSMEEAVSVGTQIGALVVMAKGDMEGLPEREQLEAFSQARSDVLR